MGGNHGGLAIAVPYCPSELADAPSDTLTALQTALRQHASEHNSFLFSLMSPEELEVRPILETRKENESRVRSFLSLSELLRNTPKVREGHFLTWKALLKPSTGYIPKQTQESTVTCALHFKNEYIAYIVAIHLAAWASLWTVDSALFDRFQRALSPTVPDGDSDGWKVQRISKKDELRRALAAIDGDTTVRPWRSLTDRPTTAFAVQDYSVTYKRETFVSVKLDNLAPDRVNVYNLERCPRFNAWKEKHEVLNSSCVKWHHGDLNLGVAVWASPDVAKELPNWLADLDPQAKANISVVPTSRKAESDGERRSRTVPLLPVASNDAPGANPAAPKPWSQIVNDSTKARIAATTAQKRRNLQPERTESNASLLHIIEQLQATNAALVQEMSLLRAQVNSLQHLQPQVQHSQEQSRPQQQHQQAQSRPQQQHQQAQSQPQRQSQAHASSQPALGSANKDATHTVTTLELDARLAVFREALRKDFLIMLKDNNSNPSIAPADRAPMVEAV